MLRFLSYLNIFIAPVYFLLYYQDAVNYLVAAGLTVLITFSGLLIKQEDQIEFKNINTLKLASVLTCAFLCYQGWLVYQFYSAIDLDYLAGRTASYAISSVLYTLTILSQLFLYFKKVSV